MKTTNYYVTDVTDLKACLNLYPAEGIEPQESLDNMADLFFDIFNKDIQEKLDIIGGKLVEVKPWSPKFYNYTGDDLMLMIEFNDPELKKYQNWLSENFKELDEMFRKDTEKVLGYSLYKDEDPVKEEINSLKNNNLPDFLAIRHLLKGIDFNNKFTDEDVNECLVFDDEYDKCED